MNEAADGWDGILQGGPFLEFSFLLEAGAESRIQLLERVLDTLRSLSFPITFYHPDQYPNITRQFNDGYLDDPDDPKSRVYHVAKFPLIISFPEERKATLFVAEVASHTIHFDFWLYGSEFDAPEWNQRGISFRDKPKLLAFFEELYRAYRFPLGVIGWEADCLDMFSDHPGWPNEAYRIARFDPTKMPAAPGVDVVLWQGAYLRSALLCLGLDPERAFSVSEKTQNGPRWQPPEKDELLSYVMDNLDLVDDLITGTLTYLVRRMVPPESQIKGIRDCTRTHLINTRRS